jgi:hypothetical protein
VERRKSSRFNLHAPAIFSWVDADGTKHHSSGFTRDIAKDSVFVWSPEGAPTQSTVHAEVLLPKLESGAKFVRILVEGVVVRAPAEPEEAGVAVVFRESNWEFVDP